MDITLLVALFLLTIALGLGIAVGWWRGPVVGIALGFAVLMVGSLAFVGVLALSLPM